MAFRQSINFVDDNRAVTAFQQLLAYQHDNLSSWLQRAGRPEEALAIRQGLADANRTVTEYQRDLATIHNQLGRLLARQKRFAEAFTALDAAPPAKAEKDKK